MTASTAFSNWSPFGTASNPLTPTWQICHDTACMLDASSGTKLIENLQRAIDDIFLHTDPYAGQQFSPHSSLLTVTQNSISDYQAYCDLLNVNGPVFRAIDRLMRAEPNWRYRAQRGNEIGSDFNRSIGKEAVQLNFLELNPFEYYFYRFAQHLLSAAKVYPHADFDRLECAYVALLMDYLTSFLPADGIFPNCLVSPSVNTPSPAVDHRNGRYLLTDHQSTTNRWTPFGLLRRELFRDNAASAEFSSPKSQATKFADVLWKSVAFVFISLNSWFDVPDARSQPTSSPFSASIPQMTSVSSGRGNPMISGVVAVVNRILVEHLHQFTFGPSSSIIDPQFRDFKERHVPKMLDGRIWIYLQYAFDKWPLDSSFRLLLELWFAYIQPWRVAFGNAQGERNYDSHWQLFVKEHSGIYSTFFRSAMVRFLRMDLTAYKNAFSLYRMAHVFSQPNLTAALGWNHVETSSPVRLHDASDVILEADVGKLVVAVAERAREAAKSCQRAIAERKNTERRETWTAWIYNQLFSENDESAQWLELERTRDCLEVSAQHFQHAFGFRLYEEEPLNGHVHQRGFTTPLRGNREEEPDCEPDDDGRLHLTPRGRLQLLNANRRFDFKRVARPSDMAPIDPSIEVGFLARLLQALSSKINSKYERKFEILYRQPRGMVPWVARKCLEPPTRLARRNSPVIERQPSEKKARLNLRPLATYRFLVKFFLFVVFFGFLLGFRNLFLVVLLLLFGFLIAVYCVLEYHPKVRND